MQISEIIELIGQLVDIAGVSIIIVGIVSATAIFLNGLVRRKADAYPKYRRGLGQALLLGLELLVAADIIRTVAVTPTLQSVLVLAVIVVIRTFLSWSLEVEVRGRWPWQRGNDEQSVEA